MLDNKGSGPKGNYLVLAHINKAALLKGSKHKNVEHRLHTRESYLFSFSCLCVETNGGRNTISIPENPKMLIRPKRCKFMSLKECTVIQGISVEHRHGKEPAMKKSIEKGALIYNYVLADVFDQNNLPPATDLLFRRSMTIPAVPNRKPPKRSSETFIHKLYKNPKAPFAFSLLLADAVLTALIIVYVPYTKIDWDAYMSQVDGFIEGERDYSNLKGDTGPLVYPAGFLYVYSAIQYFTGGHVYPAQILFGFLYIVNLGIMLFIYVKTDVVPWWALTLLSLSKRLHSIFVLRLFNDCFAMTLLHASLVPLLYQKWHLGLIIFSAAVSVKMNVLLFAPSLFILMLKGMDIIGVISALTGAALVQILLGLPFLVSYPIAYLSNAFNLGRVFIHFWSVNFKFIPEPIFVSKEFALILLVAHLGLLTIFAHYRWCKHEGGLVSFLHSRFLQKQLKTAVGKNLNSSSGLKLLKKEHIVTTMFTGNFIGIVCARSLHYQFYSWYICSLPYLLWRTSFPNVVRVVLFAGVEVCWNVFPSTVYSSIALLSLHALILWGLWRAPTEYPYENDTLHPGKKAK